MIESNICIYMLTYLHILTHKTQSLEIQSAFFLIENCIEITVGS